MIERSPGVQDVLGSISGRVIPQTFKMLLDASLLRARHLKDRSRIMVDSPLSTVKCDRAGCYINVPAI